MEEIFEVKDTNIDVKQLMETIRKNIERKKREGIITDEKLAEAEALKIGSNPDKSDFIKSYITTARIISDIDIEHYKFGIPPFLNKPVLGHMVLAFKKFIRRFLRFHTRGIFNQQVDFNRHMVQLVEALYNQVEELTEEIEKLRGKDNQ